MSKICRTFVSHYPRIFFYRHKNMKLLRKILEIVLVLLLPMGVRAQNASVVEKELTVSERNAAQGFNDTIDRLAPDFVKVSLVVCDPCDVLYSTLGHAALHLQCPIFNLDYIFSYEGENVREKIWTFLRGDLKMGMFAMTPNEFLASYSESGRGVREYTINLSPQQKQKLWEVMDNHVTEGANLPYDYFRRGCAKSVVRVIHEALGKNAIHYAPWPEKYTKQTLREIVRNFITDAPWEEFMLYFLIGVEGDKSYPCEQKLIVPTDLVEVWLQATLDNGEPVLDSEARILLPSNRHNEGTWCTPLLVAIVLLLMALFSMGTLLIKHKKYVIAGDVMDYVVLSVVTCLGVLMTYLLCFSSLPCTSWNWLIIPFNILPVICWKWRKYWALPYAAICAIWLIAMLVYPHRLIDPAFIPLTLAWIFVLLKQSQWLMSKIPTFRK